MQIVYAVHLDLPGASFEREREEAWGVVSDWLERRLGIVPEGSDGAAESASGRVSWSRLVGYDASLRGVAVVQRDAGDARWRWHTYVDVGSEPLGDWVRVRLGLDSDVEGLITTPRVSAGRPGVVRDLADRFSLRSDGWRLGEWRPVSGHQVDPYLGFLSSPTRRLPIVTLSQDTSGETFLDPARLADRLLGLAHVVQIDRQAGYLVSDRLGKSLSCFLGAIRIYWPGFSPGDDPYDHRLFVDGSLKFLGRAGVEEELFGQLGRLAGMSLDEPELRRRLKREQRAAEVERRIGEREEAMQRLAEAASSSAGSVSAEDFAAFAAEYEELEARLSEAEMASLEAEVEVERLREERDDARRQIIELAHLMRDGSESVPTPSVPTAAPVIPSSIQDAVERAQAAAEFTVFLQGAFTSATESQYPDPSRVLDDLTLIEEIARDWATGSLSAGPNEAFRQRCSGFRDGIGQKAQTQYASDYAREYLGEAIMLGPHIRRGIGPVATILRIYMYFDDENRRIVVGHVGRKLRDAGNRN